MATIFNEIKRRFDAASIPVKYIYINVSVFIVIRTVEVILRLFMKSASFAEYLEMPSQPEAFLSRPWTLLTYMFVHFDFLHILFNMLWLHWFGRIFLTFLTGRQLGGLYILGGVAGGLLFMASYNLFPFLQQFAYGSLLAGASASVMAIVFAISFYRKDYVLHLLLIGRVKLIYLAVGVLLLDVLAITSENAGGHIAHIGGALLGVLFASEYCKGRDITAFINRMIDMLVNLVRRRPTLKIHRRPRANASRQARRPETDREYLHRKAAESRAIDEILDKLKRSGYESLSSDEKRRLFDAGRK